MSMARLDPSNHPAYVRLLLETTIGTADTSTETSCAQHQSIDWFDQTAPDKGLSELQQLMTETDEERRKELKARVVRYINEETVNLMVREAQSSATARKTTRLCDLRATIPHGSTSVFHFRLRFHSGSAGK